MISIRLAFLSFIICSLLLVSASSTVEAQGTLRDYERANTFSQRVTGKVAKSSFKPNWFDSKGRFWYRVDIGDGRSEYNLVDPTIPAKHPAFDHMRMAEALTLTLGRKIDSTRLPIDTLTYSAGLDAVTIQVGDKTFNCDLKTYALRPETKSLGPDGSFTDGAVLAPQPRPRSAGSVDPDRSPDGKCHVFIRDNNVFIKIINQNINEAASTTLTTDGKPDDRYEGQPIWSPDSTKCVIFKTIPAEEHKVYLVESSPKDQVQPKLHTLDYLKPGDRVAHQRPYLFDITTKHAIPIKDDLFSNPFEIDDVQWEPDSKHFTFKYNQRGHQIMRLIRVDATSGEAKSLIEEQAKTFIDWTNKVFLHRIHNLNVNSNNAEAIWMSERDGWNHLYLYDMQTGLVKNQITKGSWVVRKVDRVDEIKRQIWFQASGIYSQQDPYYIHHCRIDFDGSHLTMLTDGDGTHTLTYSPDSSYYIDSFSRVDLPPVTELRLANTGKKVMDLEKGDASALLSTGWRYPERFVAKGRDNKTDIYGVIVRPTNFDPKRRYPVIENIYAGPQSSFVPKAFSPATGLQAMAELGFIVVQIDGMGTNNRSKAFHDVCWKHLGDAGFPDRIKWLRAAAAKYSFMDLSRIGIYGTSAGGQNALGGLLQYGDFYKVGVADCGCHDNRMDKIWWNEQWMGWPVSPEYAAQSNVTLAPKLQGKLLLMVGEMDTNVDPSSTMQVVNALIKSDKDFDLLVMPGQGHGVVGSPYGRRRLQDFFVRNLLGVEPRRTAINQ